MSEQGACILTADNIATEDDCTTHDHEPVAVYNPTTDPHRVDERTVRLAVPDTIKGAKVVAQGRFTKGGEGCYAAVEVVLLWSDRQSVNLDQSFSTHTLVMKAEASGWHDPYLYSGHYDLSREAAMTDLAAR